MGTLCMCIKNNWYFDDSMKHYTIRKIIRLRDKEKVRSEIPYGKRDIVGGRGKFIS